MTTETTPQPPAPADDEVDQAERGEAEIVIPAAADEDQKPSAVMPSAPPSTSADLESEPDIVVAPSPPGMKTLDNNTTPSLSEAAPATAKTTNDNMEEFTVPYAFYCPITKKIMEDPVVHPSGDSFEKVAAIEREASGDKKLELVTFYPNRAVKAYIDSEMERLEEAGSMRGTLRKIDTSIRTGWDKIVDKTGMPLGEFRPLPDEFYCTLTLDLCHEPVIDPDGYTYEREAIVHWVQNNGDSPVTRKSLSVEQLYDNNAVLSILLEESEKPEDEVHPCIRRWKEEMSSPISNSIVPVANPDDVNNQGITMNDPNSSVLTYGPPGTAAANEGYPGTREELEERMRQQHRLSMISLIMIIVIISFALVYLPFYLVIFAMAFCSCMYARRRFHDRRVLTEG